MLFRGCFSVVIVTVCLKIVCGAPNEVKKAVEDLSYSPMQLIQGPVPPDVASTKNITKVVTKQVIQRKSFVRSNSTPNLRSAQTITNQVTQTVPQARVDLGSASDQNSHQAVVGGGIRVLGEGVKTYTNITTMPSRVVGSGIDEVVKVSGAALGGGNTNTGDMRTRIVSSLLNTVSSQLSQANMGGAMVEEALKNRVKDMVHKIADVVVPPAKLALQTSNLAKTSATPAAAQLPAITNTVVDTLLNQFNSAVRRNDERLLQALKLVIAKVDPPKVTVKSRKN